MDITEFGCSPFECKGGNKAGWPLQLYYINQGLTILHVSSVLISKFLSLDAFCDGELVSCQPLEISHVFPFFFLSKGISVHFILFPIVVYFLALFIKVP